MMVGQPRELREKIGDAQPSFLQKISRASLDC